MFVDKVELHLPQLVPLSRSKKSGDKFVHFFTGSSGVVRFDSRVGCAGPVLLPLSHSKFVESTRECSVR